MNEEYKSVVKEIDEMLAIREIDEFLDKIEKKKKSEKGEVKEEKELKQIKKEIQEKEKEEWGERLESEKSNNLSCQVSIGSGTKEEVFELPKMLEKEVFELYECEGSKTEKQNKMSDILPGINAWASKSRYSCMENRLKRRGFKPLTKCVKINWKKELNLA